MGASVRFAILVAAAVLATASFVSTEPITLRVDKTNGGIDLKMYNTVPVAGFQGQLTRLPSLARPIPIEGPLSETAGFIFDFNNRTGIFLGVSLTGVSIPGQSDFGEICAFNATASGKYCIGELIFSDPFGTAIDFAFSTESSDCTEL